MRPGQDLIVGSVTSEWPPVIWVIGAGIRHHPSVQKVVPNRTEDHPLRVVPTTRMGEKVIAKQRIAAYQGTCSFPNEEKTKRATI